MKVIVDRFLDVSTFLSERKEKNLNQEDLQEISIFRYI
jgi:hypothetical protein